MSFFDSPLFFLTLIAVCIPAVILGLLQKSRKAYVLIASILIVGMVFFDTPVQLLYLVLFAVLSTLSAKLFLAINKKHPRFAPAYLCFLLLCLAPLVIYKISGLFHLSIFGFLGISYLTFKSVQMIIEIYDGLITEMTVPEIFSFLLFFPALSSGPIDRSRRYCADLNRIPTKTEYTELIGQGLEKLLLGAVYKFVLSALCYELVSKFEGSFSPLYMLLYAYSYGVYMFFDFAGYSLMAVGASYLFGIRTPDNFNKPFLSTDMKDFWNRWHISLSTWFRDFIFNRFMMKVLKKKKLSRLSAAFCGYMIDMLVMGVWHGLNLSYLIYGLYHGLLLGFTEIYQKKSKFHKNNRHKKPYIVLSWFITLNLVMFGFFIFSGEFVALMTKVIQKIF